MKDEMPKLMSRVQVAVSHTFSKFEDLASLLECAYVGERRQMHLQQIESKKLEIPTISNNTCICKLTHSQRLVSTSYSM